MVNLAKFHFFPEASEATSSEMAYGDVNRTAIIRHICFDFPVPPVINVVSICLCPYFFEVIDSKTCKCLLDRTPHPGLWEELFMGISEPGGSLGVRWHHPLSS